MCTKKELEVHIITIINKIDKEFPELSKYIAEMPFKDDLNDKELVHNLEEYYHSLFDLVSTYGKTHPVPLVNQSIPESKVSPSYN